MEGENKIPELDKSFCQDRSSNESKKIMYILIFKAT